MGVDTEHAYCRAPCMPPRKRGVGGLGPSKMPRFDVPRPSAPRKKRGP